MAETLTLTTPETTPNIVTYTIGDLYINPITPSIKVTLVSNTGQNFLWRYIESETVTRQQVLNVINFINQGTFKTQGKTLQQWILEQIAVLVKPGKVA